jgi:hypothetical protein
MWLKYIDGTEGNDSLFDLSPEWQRLHVARCMDCNPDEPAGWPTQVIDDLLALRRSRGKKAFHIELRRLMSPEG